MKIRYLIGLGLMALFAARGAMAVTLPGPLVTAEWLNAHKDEVTILDVREDPKTLTVAPTFEVDKKTKAQKLVKAGGHIDGALAVEFGKIRQERTVDGVKIKSQMPTAEYFTQVMDAVGLNKTDKPIVIVSMGGNFNEAYEGTRLYFQLRYFGEPRDKLALLNGGLRAWIEAGYPVSTAAPMPAKGNWVAGAEDKSILASMEEVKEALQSGKIQFIDARPTAQFLGVAKKPDNKRGGHLPNAHSLPPDALVKPVGTSFQFMGADEYRNIFAELGSKTDVPTITYCNTAHLASGPWFVMHEILGNENTKMYAGSMIEWTNLGQPTVGVMP